MLLVAALGGLFVSSGSLPLHAAVSDAFTITITPRDSMPPAAVTDLSATPGGAGQMLLQWTAPDSNNNQMPPPSAATSYQIRIATYSVDSLAGDTTAWWNLAQDVAGEPTPSAPGINDSLLLNGLTGGITYYAGLISFDGQGLSSPIDLKSAALGQQARAFVSSGADTLAPDSPMGLKGTLDPSGVAFTLLWEAVTQNADGSPLSDLAGYNVYRSTSLIGPKTKLTPVPITVRAFADVVNNQTLYYTVRAIDTNGNESADSLTADSSPDANVIFIGSDNMSTLTVPSTVNDVLRSGFNKYGVPLTIGMTEEPLPSNTQIIRHIQLRLLRGDTKVAVPDISFAKPQSIIAVAYNLVGGLVDYGSPMGLSNQHRVAAVTPNQLSLFWNNGVTWVKVGGTVDPAAQVVRIKSSYLGGYQLRAAAAATSLTLEQANVYPRIITPNGDDFNDLVYFVLENPNSASVSGDIYDLGGRHVATLAQQGATGIGTTLTWDGRTTGGSVVPGGVYIYKIKGEGQTFTGTVGVAR